MDIREFPGIFQNSFSAFPQKSDAFLKDNAIWLRPGGNFEFEKTIPKPEGYVTNIQAWFYSDESLDNSVLVTDGRTCLLSLNNQALVEYPSHVLDSPEAVHTHRLVIRVKAHNRALVDRLVMKSFTLRFIREVNDPSIPGVLGLFLLVFLMMIYSMKYPVFTKRFIPILAFAFILWLGFWFRYHQLVAVRYLPLDSDTRTFVSITRDMRGLFDTAFREPAFIWLMKLWIGLWGDHVLSIRLMTLFLSLAVMVLVYFMGRRVFGETISLLCVFMMAVNPNIVYDAVRGYRQEWFMILLYSVLFLLYHKQIMQKRWGGLILGALCALLVLSNLAFGGVCVILVIAWMLFHFKSWKQALLCLGVMLLLVFPYLAHNKSRYGEWTYPMNVHTRFYRNLELSGKKGGMARVDFLTDSYAGDPVTLGTYLFRDHTTGELAKGLLRGAWGIYAGELLKTYALNKSLLLRLFYGIGLIVLLTRARHRWWLFAFFVMNYMNFFIASLGIEPRLVSHYIPLVYWIIFSGLEYFFREFSCQMKKSNQDCDL
jgi:ABC-type multidrug transport system fused ATPase/permease subunit